MTMLEACRSWVREFNAIPYSAVSKIMEFDESIQEITPPALYQRVRIWADEHCGEKGEVIETNVDDTDGLYKIKLDSGEEVLKYKDDLEIIELEGDLPIWGFMWTFEENIDTEWANGDYLGSHLQEMANAGFRIYESEDFGLLFGIDGAGYDFYGTEEDPGPWLKLYKARGLKWHKEAV